MQTRCPKQADGATYARMSTRYHDWSRITPPVGPRRSQRKASMAAGSKAMHEAGILDAVRKRASRIRGGVAAFDHLNPRQTAHIVVDLQNGFMDHGQVAEVPMARTIVPKVNRISAALRAAGGVVIYTQHTADADAVRTWPVFFEHFLGPEPRARFIETFTPGSSGHALWPELDVDEEDILVTKRRFGAFVPGSSDLHPRLQERGIDTLIISGTMSHVCCESTARCNDGTVMRHPAAHLQPLAQDLVRCFSVECTVRSRQLVEVLPLGKFGAEVDIVGVGEELIELLLIGSV